MKNIYNIYFSATNNTKEVVQYINKQFVTYFNLKEEQVSTNDYNLLESGTKFNKLNLGEEDILIVGAPVFSGRIPETMVDDLKKVRGSNTKAVLVVTYGNRAYEDSLLELKNILEEQGFVIFGATAIIAKHSIFPTVATERPNKVDKENIKEFANLCIEKINNGNASILNIPGNQKYRDIIRIPIKPKVNNNCVECSICSSICPTAAIYRDRPKKTDKKKCISCGACIFHCPENARSFKGTLYNIARQKFEKDNSKEQDIEIFI